MSYETPYVFIICAGRSGSTALQKMLNTDPRVLIRGENNNFFFHAFKANESLIEFDRGGDNPAKPWFGFRHFKANKYRKLIRKIGIQFLTGDSNPSAIRTIGFKEIRLFHVFNSDKKLSLYTHKYASRKSLLLRYMRFMNQIFPGNKTIFLARDPSEIVKSGWWAKSKNHKRIKRDLTAFHEACFEISQSTNSPYVDYDVLRSQDLAAIKSTIYDPLGLPFREEVIKESLNQRLNHGKNFVQNK